MVAFPNVSEPAQATASPFPPDQFVSIRDVPVFAEHETTTKDGRTLRFGREELTAVANRCNRRIAETGDYAALSIGHTPPAGSGLPPLKAVGFAGPFKVASLSGEMGRERYAITADFHIRRSEWEEAQKYIARRSPELWVEDTYEEMFLDPIALLGAEVPRLDMGLVYSRVHPGKLVEKYAAVFEGPGSVHIAKNYQGEAGMLDDQDLAKIVEAICQLPQWQFLESMMPQGQGTDQPPGGIPGATGAAPPAAPGMPGATPPGVPPPVPGAAPTPLGAAPAPPDAAPLPGSPNPTGAVAAAPATPPAPPVQKQAGPPLDAPGGEPGLDKPGGDPPKPPDDDKEKKDMAYQKACYAALDAMDDEELSLYMAGRNGKKYGAGESNVDGDDKPDAEAGTYNQTANEAEGVSGSEHTIQDGTGGPPRKESEKVNNSRSTSETERLKYERDGLVARVAKLEAEASVRHEEKTDANRRARILQLHHDGYIIDPDKMMERLCYSKMRDDAQFDGFVEALQENTPRAPLNLDLPYVEGAERYSRTRPGTKPQAEKYSKETQDAAYKAAMRRINAAPPMTDTTGFYQEELDKIHASNGAA